MNPALEFTIIYQLLSDSDKGELKNNQLRET